MSIYFSFVSFFSCLLQHIFYIILSRKYKDRSKDSLSRNPAIVYCLYYLNSSEEHYMDLCQYNSPYYTESRAKSWRGPLTLHCGLFGTKMVCAIVGEVLQN